MEEELNVIKQRDQLRTQTSFYNKLSTLEKFILWGAISFLVYLLTYYQGDAKKLLIGLSLGIIGYLFFSNYEKKPTEFTPQQLTILLEKVVDFKITRGQFPRESKPRVTPAMDPFLTEQEGETSLTAFKFGVEIKHGVITENWLVTMDKFTGEDIRWVKTGRKEFEGGTEPEKKVVLPDSLINLSKGLSMLGGKKGPGRLPPQLPPEGGSGI